MFTEFADTPPVSSGVLCQCTPTSAVAGVAVSAVLVLLVVAVVQSAVIWQQQKYTFAYNDQWHKIAEQDLVVYFIALIQTSCTITCIGAYKLNFRG